MDSKLPSHHFHHHQKRVTAIGMAVMSVFGALIFAVPYLAAGKDKLGKGRAAESKQALKGMPIQGVTEYDAVLHALNRLGFGPRPGDLERVKQMGLQRWIDQQLHPES